MRMTWQIRTYPTHLWLTIALRVVSELRTVLLIPMSFPSLHSASNRCGLSLRTSQPHTHTLRPLAVSMAAPPGICAATWRQQGRGLLLSPSASQQRQTLPAMTGAALNAWYVHTWRMYLYGGSHQQALYHGFCMHGELIKQCRYLPTFN